MILALLLACGLAWLVCERQSRVYARHDARDRADAGWNALQPPVAFVDARARLRPLPTRTPGDAALWTDEPEQRRAA